MDIKVTKNCIHISESWKVPKREFVFWLTDALLVCPDYPRRSVLGMELEWAGHNLLYRLHYKRDRTGDVDLESPQSAWNRFRWAVGGVLAWCVIP